jgi:hypothetical protein
MLMGLNTSLLRTEMKLFAPIVRFCFLFGFDVNRAKHVLSPTNVLHFINTKKKGIQTAAGAQFALDVGTFLSDSVGSF